MNHWHSLLSRQLKKASLSPEALPKSTAEWLDFLEKINKTYNDSDQDRYTHERSLAISSKEMQERAQALEESYRLLKSQNEARQKTEEQLSLTKSTVTSLIENLPNATAVFDENQKIIYVNQLYCDMFEFKKSPQELLGFDRNYLLQEITSKILNPEVLTASSETFTKNKKSQTHLEIKLKNGRILERDVYPIFDPQKNYKGVFTQYRDITESKELRLQLQQSDNLASIGRLAAGVAHEINNPLTYTSVNIELTLDELQKTEQFSSNSPVIDKIKKMLLDAKEGVQRVRTIVMDLKTFSRSASVSKEVLNIDKPLNSAIKMAKNEIRHRATLELNLNATPKIMANESRLAQVFLNLLVNAAQAIPMGNAEKNFIRVSSNIDENGNAKIEISDTGAGMTPEIIEKIFDPFFTTKAVGEGTGLGLSICHSIIASYNGRISVNSTVGKGTTFTVVLPPTQVTEKTKQESTSQNIKVTSTHKNIVVIDNEITLSTAINQSLKSLYQVKVFNNCKEALEYVLSKEAGTIDLILCDLMMPSFTGIDLYRSLEKSKSEILNKIIFMSGGALTEEMQTFMDQMKNRTLIKPFTIEELRGAVGRTIEQTAEIS